MAKRIAKYLLITLLYCPLITWAQTKPNIVIIYADDLGYGDISTYGATKIATPNIDKLAKNGISFTNAHSTSATCTPSRFSLLTGEYAWRQDGTHIAPGDAALIIPQNMLTMPALLQKAGYYTGVIGKWHLGLGSEGGPDWNGEIKPGPLECGFNYSFIFPATGDRVPCVFIESRKVINTDSKDPILVSYKQKIGNEPTGAENPELLKMPYSPGRGHDQTIVNGISRIGYMAGGKTARWIDEDIADLLTNKAKQFIGNHQKKPFFLYFATHDIHVPHAPNNRFVGKSRLGLRGDAILELDWTVGRIIKTLDSLHLTKNTMLIFSSDNGPAVQDGYEDGGWQNLNGHTPGGPYRGGKYSAFDAGTRVPFIIQWPQKISPGIKSSALISHADLFASFARFTGQKLSMVDAPDSFDMLDQLTGKVPTGRKNLVEDTGNGGICLITADGWKYIRAHEGAKVNKNNIELGNDKTPQLYNLNRDIGEKNNLAAANPDKVKQLDKQLQLIINQKRSR